MTNSARFWERMPKRALTKDSKNCCVIINVTLMK